MSNNLPLFSKRQHQIDLLDLIERNIRGMHTLAASLNFRKDLLDWSLVRVLDKALIGVA